MSTSRIALLLAALLPAVAPLCARGDHAPCRHNDAVAGQVFPVRESEQEVTSQTLDVQFGEHPQQLKLEGDRHWSEWRHCFGTGGRRMFSAPRVRVAATYQMANPTAKPIEREMAFPFTGELTRVSTDERYGPQPPDPWEALGHEVTCDGVRLPVRVVAVPQPRDGEATPADSDPTLAQAARNQWGYDGQFLDPDTGRLYPRGSWLAGWKAHIAHTPGSGEGGAKAAQARGLAFLRYRLAFAPHQKREVTVRYTTLADYDVEIDKLCCRPMIAQFCYLLKPTGYWRAFGPIKVTVSAPAAFRVAMNIGEWKHTEDKGSVTYTAILRPPADNLHFAIYRGLSPLADFLAYSVEGGCPPTREDAARDQARETIGRLLWAIAEDGKQRPALREQALLRLSTFYAVAPRNAERRARLAELLKQLQASPQASKGGL